MSDQNAYMDDGDYRDPIEIPRDYAAYRKEFEAYKGVPFPFARDPQASREVDYAHELAYERYIEEGRWGSLSPSSDLTSHSGGPAANHDDIEPDFEAG